MLAQTMLARLDRETGERHTAADRAWKRLLAPDISRDDYVRVLVATYGFEAPYEAACAYTPGLSQVIDLRGRWRSGLIAQDLLVLGWTPEQITNLRCHSVASFQDAAEALGWMYVVERSTLMHVDVREELAGRFVDLGKACSYLGAYEHVTSRRWAELGVALDRFKGSEKVAVRVVEAAHAAFATLDEWRQTSEPRLRSIP